jgi:hypothetical protein
MTADFDPRGISVHDRRAPWFHLPMDYPSSRTKRSVVTVTTR